MKMELFILAKAEDKKTFKIFFFSEIKNESVLISCDVIPFSPT
jgi:hypothetical protein